MDEDQNNSGYDSDRDIGPFFDAVRDEPPLHGPDEEEIGVGVTSKLPDIPDPVVTPVIIDLIYRIIGFRIGLSSNS